MIVRLQDSNSQIWVVGVSTSGLLTTTLSSGITQNEFLSVGNLSFQLGVTTGGLLTTTSVPFSASYPTILLFFDTSDVSWEVSVLSSGLLQTTLGSPVFPWVQNGFGAGTDNSIVGGAGGYMAYPQPPSPVPSFAIPEAVGQFGSLNFSYNSGTSSGAGNVFSISNPGRN